VSKLRTTLVLALSVLALALVACGEDSDYADEVRNTIVTLAQELQDAGEQAASATDDDETVAALNDAESALTVAAEDLEGFEPPEDVADLNDEVLGLIEGYRESVVETIDAIESGAPASDLEQFTVDSQAFAEAFASLRDQLVDAGIAVEETGE